MTNGSLLLIGIGRDVGLNRFTTRCSFIERRSAIPGSSSAASTSATNTSANAGPTERVRDLRDPRSKTMKLNASLSFETRFDSRSP